jgi:hypothetical protein
MLHPELKPYYTVKIPYVHERSTKYHPTTNVGPFAVLTRGCYDALDEACAWADSHLEGLPYSVALVEFDATADDDRVTIVYESAS